MPALRATACILLLLPATAEAFTQMETGLGAPVRWTSPHVVVGRRADAPSRDLDDADVSDALDGALEEWSTLPEARVRLTQGASDTTWIAFRQHDWPYAADWLACTQAYADPSTGEVSRATIEINEQDHRFAKAFTPGDGAYDLQAVLTHEVGHLLGLAHSADPLATMFVATAPDDVRKRTVGGDDREGLKAIYAPLAMNGGCSLAPDGAVGGWPLGVFFLLGFLRRINYRKR